MTNAAKPNFSAMTFPELLNWVFHNNFVNGEPVFDSDFSDIEEMYEDGEESEAFDECESMAHEIWLAMSVQSAIDDPLNALLPPCGK